MGLHEIAALREGARELYARGKLLNGGEALAGCCWGLLIVLARAYSMGAGTYTGIEAVSNSVSAFRHPVRRYGRHTLTVIVTALMVLLAGVAWLLPLYGIHAMDQSQPGYRTVLAQLTGKARNLTISGSPD